MNENRILYYHTLIPGCRAIRFILEDYKIPYRSIPTQVWNPTDAFHQLSPFGDLPVLCESQHAYVGLSPCLEYLADHHCHRGAHLMGKNAVTKGESRRLIQLFQNQFFNQVIETIVFEKAYPKEMQLKYDPDLDAIREGIKALKEYCGYFSTLIENRYNLVSDQVLGADMVAACSFSLLDFFGHLNWSDYRPLKEWYLRIKSKPAFRALLEDKIYGFTPSKFYKNLDF